MEKLIAIQESKVKRLKNQAIKDGRSVLKALGKLKDAEDEIRTAKKVIKLHPHDGAICKAMVALRKNRKFYLQSRMCAVKDARGYYRQSCQELYFAEMQLAHLKAGELEMYTAKQLAKTSRL